jgi:hypothetical protein
MDRMRARFIRKLSDVAHIAQSVEHFLGKEEVIGSNPIVSTICRSKVVRLLVKTRVSALNVGHSARDSLHQLASQALKPVFA